MSVLRQLLLGGFLAIIFLSCSTTKKLSDDSQAVNKVVSNTPQTADEVPKVIKQPVYRPEAIKEFDLVHTKLEVAFNWEKRYLFGKATVQVKPHFYPQQTLILDAKGFDIHEVLLLDGEIKTKPPYKYDGKELKIDLGREIGRTETITVFIDYTAKSYELKVHGSDAILEDRGLYFVNHDGSEPNKPQQIWTQGETEANSCWFPTIDAPNQKTTQETYITIENKFKTLSNGDLIYSQLNEDGTRTDYWRMDKPHAPYLFMMAIGEFEIVKDEWNGMPVDYYLEPEYAPYAKDIFGNTPEMLDYFAGKFGYEYPWSKYAQVVVRDYVSGAMENTTASLYMEEVQMTSRELLDEDYEDVIAHELVHQWFGDLVTCESWANLTLNEGFASYGEYMWTEYKDGEIEAAHKLYDELTVYISESRSKKVDLVRFHYEDKENMFDNHSYAKGGLVLHMLRDYVGDEAFFASLTNYLKRNQYKDVEIHDLRLAFEEVTGEDLNWFFEQWFLAKGHPELEIKQNYVDSTKSFLVEIYQRQDPDEFPVYKLPLDVTFFTGNGVKEETIWIKEQADTFIYSMNEEPLLFLANSNEDLVVEIFHEKNQSEWVLQAKNAKNPVSRLRAYKELVEDTTLHLSNTFYQGLSDGYAEIQMVALDYARQMGDSIVVAWQDKIVELANTAPDTEVRSEAIFTIFEAMGEQGMEVYEKAVNDSSYLVAGSGLYALLQHSDSNALLDSLVNQFIDENNVNVVLPLANFFMLTNDTTRLGWFKHQIDYGKPDVQYYLLRMMGQYMMGLDVEEIEDGIGFISEYAMHNSKYYIRIAAYQSLQLFEENLLAKEKLEQIVLNEKDDRVRRFFN